MPAEFGGSLPVEVVEEVGLDYFEGEWHKEPANLEEHSEVNPQQGDAKEVDKELEPTNGRTDTSHRVGTFVKNSY